VTSETFTATVTLGDLSSLVDRAGNVFVTNNALNPAVIIHRVTGDHRATADEGPTTVGPGQRVVRTFGQFSDLTGASATGSYEVLAGSGDLIVTQACVSPSSGVWGVEWGIASVPLGMNIIVPGQSGIKLTRNMGSWTFDYPQGWESQLVIVEGAGRGFYVWAEDALGRYKRLTVRRAAEGWRLGFATLNVAPFDPLTNCASVKWHVNVYAFPKRICG
jgi:hypothetical protein